MTFTRRLMLGAGAFVLPLTAVMALGAVPASAQRTSATVEGGTITCSGIKGSVTFTPPLTNSGTAQETATIVKIKITKCKNLSGATKVPKKGSASSDIATSTSTDSCASLEGTSSTPDSTTIKVNWKPSSIAYSGATYGNFTVTTGPPPKDYEELVLPAAGYPGTTTNSYADSNSTATIVLGETQATLANTCATSSLKSIKIVSGSDST